MAADLARPKSITLTTSASGSPESFADDHQIAGLKIPMTSPCASAAMSARATWAATSKARIRGDEAIATDIGLDGFAFDQFHRIEASASVGFAKMKDRQRR